jgi:hypothetical protein
VATVPFPLPRRPEGWRCAGGGLERRARPDLGLGGWVRPARCRAACCPPVSLWSCDGPRVVLSMSVLSLLLSVLLVAANTGY